MLKSSRLKRYQRPNKEIHHASKTSSSRDSVLYWLGAKAPSGTFAQSVKSAFDKKTDFKKYKKYGWGHNYLLTRQHPEDQARINLAIIDSINRDLQSSGFAPAKIEPGLHHYL